MLFIDLIRKQEFIWAVLLTGSVLETNLLPWNIISPNYAVLHNYSIDKKWHFESIELYKLPEVITLVFYTGEMHISEEEMRDLFGELVGVIEYGYKTASPIQESKSYQNSISMYQAHENSFLVFIKEYKENKFSISIKNRLENKLD